VIASGVSCNLDERNWAVTTISPSAAWLESGAAGALSCACATLAAIAAIASTDTPTTPRAKVE